MTSIPVKIRRIKKNPIHMQLSKKNTKKNSNHHWISEIYIKFRTFWKNDKSQSLDIYEIVDCEKSVYLNAQKVITYSQRVYGSKALLKSAQPPFYPIATSSREIFSWKTFLLVRSGI